MPPMNLSWTVFKRPVKPVAFALMLSMVVLGVFAILDLGVLGTSRWADLLGIMAFIVAASFEYAWIKRSQNIAEWALLGAFFVWGFRFWAIILVQGYGSFRVEGFYLSVLWALLAGGSWLLERSDPNALSKNWGGSWTRD